MLVDINFNMHRDVGVLNVLDLLSEVRGVNDVSVKQLARGVYECGHFNFDHEIGLSSRDPWECRYPTVNVVPNVADLVAEGKIGDDRIVKLAPYFGDMDIKVRDTGYIGAYGVCDDYKQVIAMCQELQDDHLVPYVMSVTEVNKATEPEDGGWRWHKWGQYIGIHDPQCEYIAHEPAIEKVYCYHIYKMPVRLFGSILQNAAKPIDLEPVTKLAIEWEATLKK